MTVKLTRRYTYLVLVLAAYTILIIATKWSFFSQLYLFMEKERANDDVLNHVTVTNMSTPVSGRSQRHINSNTDVIMVQTGNGNLYVDSPSASKPPALSNRLRSQRFFNAVFASFLHP